MFCINGGAADTWILLCIVACVSGGFSVIILAMAGKASLEFDPAVLCVAVLDECRADVDLSLRLLDLGDDALRGSFLPCALLLRRTLDFSELFDELDDDLCFRRRSLSLLVVPFVSASLENEARLPGGATVTYLGGLGTLAILTLCFSVSMCTNTVPLSSCEGPQRCFLHKVQ